jgi:peptidoglycan LD-endopeptidase CwlK
VNLRDIITACQRELGRQGHKIDVDGVAGPETWGAIHSELIGHEVIEDTKPNLVDARSEKNIATLHPKVRPYARALVKAAEDQNIKMVVTSGTRTPEEQDALYAQGRTKPGNVVTNAKRWQSNHNYGIAFDLTLFNGGSPVWDSPKYRQVGALGQSIGLNWGGDFGDEPHYALRPSWARGMSESKMITELKRRHDAGKDAFA